MLLRYGDQEIDLFGKIEPDHTVLCLSGGLDSTSLLYLICKFFPHIKVTPAIAVDAYAKFDALCANDTIAWMKTEFPNHNILETQSFNFDHTDPYWLKQAELVSSDSQDKSVTIEGTSKNLQMAEGFRNISTNVKCNFFTSGITANPPDEVMKKRGFFDLAEPNRNEPRNKNTLNGGVYRPYINVDKKFIAGIYREHELMESLFPYTSSCVGMPHETDYGQKECGKCFWCQEKQWGFE